MKRKRALAIFAAGVVLGCSASWASAQEPGATAVVKDFYAWDLAQPNGNWTAHFDQAQRFFDAGLYQRIQASLARQLKNQDMIFDFDPFVNAQWNAAAYKFGTPAVKGADTQIPVTLTLSGRPNATSKLTMVVRQEATGFVIYNIIYDPTFNLRDYLQTALK
jgi:Protein of unknown function (DUF3828)